MKNQYFSRKYIACVSSFFLFFMMRILFSSLVSVFLLDQGYSALTVSIVSAIALIASFFVVPIIGNYTDIYGTNKVSTLLLIISSITGAAFAFSKNLLLTGLLYCIVTICINTLHPIIEKQATQTDFSYGSVRIWGTLGNAVGTQLGGILYQYISPQSVYIVFALTSIISLIGLEINSNGRIRSDINDAPAQNKKSLKPSVIFLLYIVVVFFFYAALDSKTLYLTAFLKESGFSVNEASTILFFASLLEIPIVLFGGHLIDKLSSKPLVISCLILLGIQLSIYALFNSYVIIIIVTLATNSVVSMLYIMINMKVISELIDSNHQLTALTVITGVRSLAAVVSQTIGGQIIDLYSYNHFFILLSSYIILAILLTLTIKFPKRNDNLHLYT